MGRVLRSHSAHRESKTGQAKLLSGEFPPGPGDRVPAKDGELSYQ